MTALKNQFQKARAVMQALVHGLHPATGVELPREDIVNDIEVNRAMSTAVMALDQMVARLTRREMLPEKVGQGWTEAEEQQLRDEFSRSESLALIATKHGRTLPCQPGEVGASRASGEGAAGDKQPVSGSRSQRGRRQMNSFAFIGIGSLARNPEVTAKGDVAYVRFCLIGADHAEPDEEVGHAREVINCV